MLEITTSDGARIYPAKLAHVTGTVYDNTKGTPLSAEDHDGVARGLAETWEAVLTL